MNLNTARDLVCSLDSPHQKILVVDDDLDILDSLCDLLELEGHYDVKTASNIRAGQGIAANFTPDLVLLDVKLGKNIGLNLIPALKDQQADVVCIVMTAYREIDYSVKALRLGADDYFFKPLEPVHLLRTIESYLHRQQLKRERSKYERRFRAVFNQTFQLLFLLDPDGTLNESNDTVTTFFGHAEERLIGKLFWQLPWWDSSPWVRNQLKRAISAAVEGEPSCHEIDVREAHNEMSKIFLSIKPVVDERGRINHLVVEARDITQRKKDEETIKAALQQTEMLLREVHHRVKNNLQTISSLLHLQSRNIKDQRAREIFQESENRIHSMALVHERSYQSSDLAAIDFRTYVSNMASNLLAVYEDSTKNITLHLDVAEEKLDVDTVIPCGLIINELLTNALKYAFRDSSAGKIFITFQRFGDRAVLTVRDSGAGLPQDVDVRKTSSFGLQLVTILVDQLAGELEIDNEDGAVFKISFSPKWASPG